MIKKQQIKSFHYTPIIATRLEELHSYTGESRSSLIKRAITELWVSVIQGNSTNRRQKDK